MSILSQLIYYVPLALTGLILLWLLYLEVKDELTSRLALRYLLIVILINILQIASQVGLLYWQLKKDPFGQYLLPGKSDYFTNIAISQSLSLAWPLAAALVIILGLILIRKVLKSTIIDKTDLALITLTFTAVGFSSITVLIGGTFIWMILVQVFAILKNRKKKTEFRLKMTPFLLVVAFIILILNNFDFYWKLLQKLHLE